MKRLLNYIANITKAWFALYAFFMFFLIPLSLALKTLQWAGLL